MKLYIDTTKPDGLTLKLETDNFIVEKTVKAHYQQAEKLLPTLEKLLTKHQKTLQDISQIIVKNNQGSFTSLRIGITTANALAYALDLPIEDDQGKNIKQKKIKLVQPHYSQSINISLPKKT